MPKYDIKRGATIIASVIAEGSQNVEAMGVNEVNMKFTLINPVVFQVGDWCTVYGNKYVVYRKPEYTKINERQHEYDLYLVHEFYKLQDSLLMGIDKNAILNEKVFDLTGNLQAFADLVLLNANRNDSGWTLGTVDVTDAKTLQFDGENILASLNRIASEFETEFWIEGKTISFAKRLTNSGITLSYGENKGLISLTKGNKDANATIFTRLFVEGAERNLPSYTNYGYKRLQLPSANNGKVDNASAIAAFGVIEHYAKFDDIFPKHTGTITSVGDEFTFYDTNLPFDVNAQLLPGVTAYVSFQSGVLAGYNFDISSFDNATKKFVININEDEKAATLPNTTLKPAVGDTYIVFDIQMPQTHITAAENALLAKANELLAQGSDIDFNDAFSGNCDPLYFKRNSITPVLGQYARLFETNPAIDVTKRMSKISRDLQNPDKYEITFTDKIEVNTVVREYIKNIEETLVVNEALTRTITNRDAVRRAAQRIDILRDDVFDPDGYFDGTHLKPETIEAIMATFGYKSGSLTLEGVAFSLNVGGVANNFNITSGKLIHFSYDVSGAYVWDMGSMTSSFTDSAQGYYIYAKISKTALTGAWVVNNQKLQVDNEEGYYTLLIGRVYPVVNGKREIDLLYGVTNIVGNRIQTGIIQDLAGTNFWNLDTGEMRVSGQITVGAGSNVYTQAETDNKVNNKSKNFTTTPTNYQTGDTWTLQSDTWVNGIVYKQGDVLTASAASASYNQVHWTKQVRYTDDTAFNTMQFPTTNLLDDGEYMKFDPYSTGTGTSLFIYWGEGWSNNFHEATPDSGKTLKIISPVTANLVDNAFGIASAYINFRSNDPTLSCSIMFEDYPSSKRTYYANGHSWVQIQTNPQKTDYYHPNPKIILEMNQTNAKLQYNRVQFVYGTINPSWTPSVNDVRNEINNAAGDLEDYVNGAFEDGVIEQAEAKAIEKYTNIVNETYEQLTQQYSVVYGDSLLTGTPKTNLATAKSNLDSAKSALISSITTAIADGKTTGAEKSDVDSKYANFKTRIGEYTTASENAYKSITDAINATANGKAIVHYENEVPTGKTIADKGDLWVDTNDNNKLYVWDGSDWVLAQDYFKALQKIGTLPGGIEKIKITNFQSVTAEITTNSNYPVSSTVDGSRTGQGWANGTGGWDGQGWVDYIFTSSKKICQIDVITLQDSIQGVEPTLDMVFSLYGITGYTLQYWNGSTWVNIISVTGNNKVWRQHTFPEVETDKIRVQTGYGSSQRIVEVEIYENIQGVKTVVEIVADAQQTADSKSKGFFQDEAPTGLVANDKGSIWIDTNDNNKLYTWSGTAWVLSQDYYSAQQTASEAKIAAENADEAADVLSEYVDGAFKDGVIEAAEAKAIEKYTNIVNETYEQLVNSYNVLYNDALLTGSAKTNLASAKTNLDTSKNTLLSAITNAIADGKTTSAEKAAVDSAYTDFKTKIGAYTTASDNAYKSITDALNVKATDAQTAVASKITFWSSLPTTGQYKVNDLWKPAANMLIDGVFFLAGKIYICTATGGFFGQNWKVDETISFGATLPPTNTAKLNDLFINESDSNKVYVFNGTSWVVKADSRIQEALDASNNAAKIFRGNGSSLPTNYKTGNLFVPTTTFSSGGRQFVGGATYQAITDSATFSQTHWIALSSEEAKQALNDAANALAANEFVDGRRTNNDNPTWYLTNYPRKTRKELKELNAIGIYGYGTYGGLTTIIPYIDSSAGWVLITQEVTVAQRTFTRTAVDGTNWSSWIDLKAETDAANALVPTFMGSAFPSNPKTGSKWFDTTTMLWKEWNGSSWVTMLDSDKMTAKYLRDALSKNTDLIGGLILTSVIGVRNSASQVTAYINGNGNTYGEGIAIATGVTDFGLATETQKGVDRHNGSGFRAGNKLWWDKDGNAKVGGFFLLNDKLSSALTGERTEIVSNGIIRGFNSGGNKGYELKSVNGRYALTFYAPDGSVAYKIGQDGTDIPASAESFTPVGMYKFTGLPTTYAALTTAQKSTASSLIKTNSSRSGGIITVSLTMATKYLYDAGNNASTPTNAPYNGYKDSNTDRTDHVSDGWYGLDFPPQFGVIGVYDLVFIQDGKIVSGSNTGVQISYAASLAFLNAGVYIQAAGAKDRHYPTLTISEAVNDSIEVFYTISEDITYGTVGGSIVLESGKTATTTAESLGANFLETSPTIEARITITSISITETTAVSDGLERTLTY